MGQAIEKQKKEFLQQGESPGAGVQLSVAGKPVLAKPSHFCDAGDRTAERQGSPQMRRQALLLGTVTGVAVALVAQAALAQSGTVSPAPPAAAGAAPGPSPEAAPVPRVARPFEDFTFRRVRAPEPGTRPRIDVQIDPAEQARRLAAFPDVVPRPPTPDLPLLPEGLPGAQPSGFEWYWAQVSPRVADAGPGRVTQALAALQAGPDGPVQGPRLQALQGIADRWHADILRHTANTRVSPALVLAVIAVESAGQVDAVSSAGAGGLMQLMPDTAARFGVTDRMDPGQNIRGGVAYLDWLLDRFDGDAVLALAGYNAGEGAVDRNAGVPPFAETRAYVPKVLAAWTVAKGLCLTEPMLLSDPCVLSVRRVASN
jgi:hypothetical protein